MGWVSSREIALSGAPTPWAKTEGNISRNAIARYGWAPRGQRPQARAETSCAETGRSRQSALACRRGPHGQKESTTMMHDDGKSDKPIVPAKGANKEQGRPCSAECLEERGLAKENGEDADGRRVGQADDVGFEALLAVGDA